MSKLRSFAHMEEQLGEDRVAVLTDPSNTGKVKAFCDQLLKDALSTKITVGGRTYKLLGFLRGNETSVGGQVMVSRAKEMNAYPGKDDGEHFLKHQEEIPAVLRGKVVFIFPDWRDPDNPENVAYVFWLGERWVQFWRWLADDFYGDYRVPRRK